MDAWSLPTSLNVAGKEYPIRSDYRVVLDILQCMNDPEIFEPDMTEDEKRAEQVISMLAILYIDFDDMPPGEWEEAAEKACEFIDCGFSEETKRKRPKLMDWIQDATIIIPSINKVAGKDVRGQKYLHWWTFFAFYMEIGEGTFATVVSIRDKKAKGKKLDKWEQEYYRDNKAIIDLKSASGQRSEEEKAALRELFGISK